MLCLPQRPQLLRALARSKSLCREQSRSLTQASKRCRSFPYNKADYRAYSPPPPPPPLNTVEEAGDFNKPSSKFAVQIMAKGDFNMKMPLLSNESCHYKSDYHKQRHQSAESGHSNPKEPLSRSVSAHTGTGTGTDYEELVSSAARVVGFDDSNPGDSPLPCSSPHVDTDYDQPINVARIVDAHDLNLGESLLPRSTPNSNTDYDEAENLGPSGSNPSGFVAVDIISGDGHNEFDPQHQRPMATSLKVFMLIGLSIEMLSAGFDQASSPRKPLNALISLLLAVVAVLICILELLDKVIKDSMALCTLPDFLGFGLAFIQCASSAVQYYFYHRHESNPVKLSLVSLFCLFWLVVLKWKN